MNECNKIADPTPLGNIVTGLVLFTLWPVLFGLADTTAMAAVMPWALAAAPGIAGLDAAVFSVGSDGTDGPTDAAGGYVDGETLAALAAKGLSVPAVLADNDAYHALQAVGGLLVTGPTGTNVNDVAVALVNG